MRQHKALRHAPQLQRTAGAIVGSLLLLLAPAAAQEPSTTVDEVEIIATDPKSEKAISGFVSTTSVKSGTGQMGRWDKEVCLSVTGLKPEYADFIAERISTEARQVGLVIGAPGCKPDLIVIATDNAEQLLALSVKANQRAFLDDQWTIQEGRGKLNELIASDSPVRWWFVAKRVLSDGSAYEQGALVQSMDWGKTGASVRADFDHVFVILDVSRIRTVRFAALADYIAMVSLAQTSPEAEFAGVPTILRLFADREAGLEPAVGMTDWDRAFLKALYEAPRNAKRITIQERDITRAMRDALASKEQPAGE